MRRQTPRSRGDRVGLAVYATTAPRLLRRARRRLPAQAHKILQHALLDGTATIDASIAAISTSSDVAVRVIEHLRPLDPRGLADVRRGDLDKLATRADAMRAAARRFRVPSYPRLARCANVRPAAGTSRRMGIDSPPRAELGATARP
jgi:hypothetical protein